MAFPSTGIIDDFNRADQAGLGASWVSPFRGAEASLDIASNTAVHPTGSGGAGAYWDDTFGPDAEAFVTLLTAAAGPVKRVEVYVRVQGPGPTVSGYAAVYKSTPDVIEVGRLDVNVLTTLAVGSGTLAAGDKLGVEAVGSTIKCHVFQGGAWAEQVSATDGMISGAGANALRLAATTWVLEEFGGGTTVSPTDADRAGGMVMAGP